jgi:hypothetical protein
MTQRAPGRDQKSGLVMEPGAGVHKMSAKPNDSAYETFYKQYGPSAAWKLATAFNDRKGGAFTVYLDACVEMARLRQEYARVKLFQTQVQSQHQVLLQNAKELRRLREQLTALHNLVSIANNKTMCHLDFKNITLGTLRQAVNNVESDGMHDEDGGGAGGGGAVVAPPAKNARCPRPTTTISMVMFDIPMFVIVLCVFAISRIKFCLSLLLYCC